MIVCERCLAYLESREGKMIHKDVESMDEILDNLKDANEETKQKVIVDADEEIVRCEWCEEEFETSELIII